MKRAVFLDRDGTIIQEKSFLHRPEEVLLIPGAQIALERLQTAGFLLFIVTNQSGVGRGYFTMADVDAVNQRVLAMVGPLGVHFQKIYVAPEAPGALLFTPCFPGRSATEWKLGHEFSLS